MQVGKLSIKNELPSPVHVTLNPWVTFFSLLAGSEFELNFMFSARAELEVDLSDEGLFVFATNIHAGQLVHADKNLDLRMAGSGSLTRTEVASLEEWIAATEAGSRPGGTAQVTVCDSRHPSGKRKLSPYSSAENAEPETGDPRATTCESLDIRISLRGNEIAVDGGDQSPDVL